MAAKKTTKKTVKKTYPSVKKTTIPKLKKKSTVEELAAAMKKMSASIDRLSLENQKTSAELRESEKALQEALQRTIRTVKNTSKTVKNTSKTVDELSRNVGQKTSDELRESEKALQEALQRTIRTVENTSKTVDELSRNVGRVNNKLGSMVEYIVIPQIRHSINTAGGHSFINIMADTKIRSIINDEKKDIAQIDVFLYNDTEAMAVEIKTDLHLHDVNDHIDRLRKLRKHEEKLDITGKKLFGAVAGVIVDHRARTLALENGLYVVNIKEYEEMLYIEKPESCRAW